MQSTPVLETVKLKYDILIPAELKGLFVSGAYTSRWSRKG